MPVDRADAFRKLSEAQETIAAARIAVRMLPQFDTMSMQSYHFITNAMDAAAHAADLVETHLRAAIEVAGDKGKIDAL